MAEYCTMTMPYNKIADNKENNTHQSNERPKTTKFPSKTPTMFRYDEIYTVGLTTRQNLSIIFKFIKANKLSFKDQGMGRLIPLLNDSIERVDNVLSKIYSHFFSYEDYGIDPNHFNPAECNTKFIFDYHFYYYASKSDRYKELKDFISISPVYLIDKDTCLYFKKLENLFKERTFTGIFSEDEEEIYCKVDFDSTQEEMLIFINICINQFIEIISARMAILDAYDNIVNGEQSRKMLKDMIDKINVLD